MKSLKTLSILFAASVAFASCEQAPKSDDAKTTDAKTVDSTKKADAQELKLDLATSTVTWVGTKPTDKHNGTLGISEGSISVKENKVVGGKFTLNIKDIKVLDIKDKEKNGYLVSHLQNEDFFDVAKFPTGTFEITSVEGFKADSTAQKVDEKEKEYTLTNPTHTVTGNLTLKSITKSISFPAIVKVEGGKVTAEAKFNINRKDWKVDTDKLKDKLIGDKVHIGLNISTAAAQ